MPFLLQWKSGIILNSEENLSLLEATLGKQVDGESFLPVVMRQELLVSILP
ncbi:Uncharacterised protein [Mycobacterium tuberculosis]|nr:Uncharacterised protein [Mycobacterium tuberculosis]